MSLRVFVKIGSGTRFYMRFHSNVALIEIERFHCVKWVLFDINL